MKSKLLLGMTLLVAMSISTTTFAQETASGSGTANILEALAISHVGANPLDFGDIIPNTGGTVKILNSAAGTRSLESGDCELVGNAGGSARFNITGHPNTAVDLSVDSNVTLTETVGGTETMTSTLSLSSSSITLAGDGTGSIYVGGTLTIGAAQLVGTYNGTFDVTVSYQ